MKEERREEIVAVKRREVKKLQIEDITIEETAEVIKTRKKFKLLYERYYGIGTEPEMIKYRGEE